MTTGVSTDPSLGLGPGPSPGRGRGVGAVTMGAVAASGIGAASAAGSGAPRSRRAGGGPRAVRLPPRRLLSSPTPARSALTPRDSGSALRRIGGGGAYPARRVRGAADGDCDADVSKQKTNCFMGPKAQAQIQVRQLGQKNRVSSVPPIPHTTTGP